MADVFRCLACGHQLRAPNVAPGRSVRCPGCGLVVPKPTSEPVPVAEVDPGPEPPAARETAPPADDGVNWHRVRLGLVLLVLPPGVVLVGAILTMIGWMANFAGLFGALSHLDPMDPSLDAVAGNRIVVWVIGGIQAVICCGLTVSGHLCCLSSPRENGARLLALLGLGFAGIGSVFQGSYLVFMAVFAPLPLTIASPGGDWIRPVGGLLMLGWFFADIAWFHALLFYLRAVALSVRSPGLPQALVALIAVSGVTSLLLSVMPVWIFLGSLSGSVAGAAGALLVILVGSCCLSGLMGLTVLVWWVVTHLLVRAAVGTFLANGG